MSDDTALAAAFDARSADGLDRAYRAYGALLFAVARSVLLDPSDAEDCVHDTLLRLWQSRGYRPERGTLRAYLVVAVRNDAISRVRDAARHARIEQRMARTPDDSRESGDAAFGDPVERGRLRAALAALPADQREAVALTFFHHLTHTEAAARLDVPLGTIKGRLRLAFAKLHAALREPPP